MVGVIQIYDLRSAETRFVTTRSAGHLHAGWTSNYRAAARFDEDEIEEEVQFWRSLLDSPDIQISAVE